MRDRLIELIRESINGCARTLAGVIADYLLENGVIVPPCKVGDTVYEFFDVPGFYSITELTVENITVGVNPKKCVLYTKSKKSNSRYRFFDDSFGKTLFFTREEAERALRKEDEGK